MNLNLELKVTSRNDAMSLFRPWRPTHLVSIADAALFGGFSRGRIPGHELVPAENCLFLLFDDITIPRVGFVEVSETDIRFLLYLADRLAPAMQTHAVDPPRLLVHCEQGISRSPAAAIIILARLLGSGLEREAVRTVRAVCGQRGIVPNDLMVRLADNLLERGGRLYAAVRSET